MVIIYIYFVYIVDLLFYSDKQSIQIGWKKRVMQSPKTC